MAVMVNETMAMTVMATVMEMVAMTTTVMTIEIKMLMLMAMMMVMMMMMMMIEIVQTRTQSLFTCFVGEKIGYEDRLRCAGCHGKKRRKNSDWQISFDRSLQSCVKTLQYWYLAS